MCANPFWFLTLFAPLLQRRKQINHVIVWIQDLRVTLSPKCVPRRFAFAIAARDQARVRRIYLSRIVA